ncbi:hypothetical protein FOTG_01629 [Fusarium oxysporum f. sp. vasinfectum 25433]|uniref:Uncharacterized protein n=1 Tax=Fusarium oxysporum f. sp. vasinfectum 25433 TaxID=1089449 RepID=X0MA33_FUSOX|nr:hypothetical protein FOTG_01629 [Fusarium oxysporum f. sp. vasinfectum 25433]
MAMQGSVLSSDVIELSSEAVHNDQYTLSCRVRRQLYSADNKTVEPFHHDPGLKAKVSELSLTHDNGWTFYCVTLRC